METISKTPITVQTIVQAPVEKVWAYWTSTEHITQWNNASDDWHTPSAENDLRPGGKFLCRMEARDGSFGFDFGGVYDELQKHKLIRYTIGDGRKVSILFTKDAEGIKITETFEAEHTHPIDMQRIGWQNILDNFKKYTESH